MATATVNIEGFLSGDSVLRFTKSGVPVLGWSIPVTPQRRTDDGKWEDTGETVWYDASLWGGLAEGFANILVKGTRVRITGTLYAETYNDKQRFKVKVEQIGVVEKRGQQSHGFSQAPSQQSSQQDVWGQSAGASYDQAPPF